MYPENTKEKFSKRSRLGRGSVFGAALLAAMQAPTHEASAAQERATAISAEKQAGSYEYAKRFTDSELDILGKVRSEIIIASTRGVDFSLAIEGPLGGVFQSLRPERRATLFDEITRTIGETKQKIQTGELAGVIPRTSEESAIMTAFADTVFQPEDPGRDAFSSNFMEEFTGQQFAAFQKRFLGNNLPAPALLSKRENLALMPQDQYQQRLHTTVQSDTFKRSISSHTVGHDYGALSADGRSRVEKFVQETLGRLRKEGYAHMRGTVDTFVTMVSKNSPKLVAQQVLEHGTLSRAQRQELFDTPDKIIQTSSTVEILDRHFPPQLNYVRQIMTKEEQEQIANYFKELEVAEHHILNPNGK